MEKKIKKDEFKAVKVRMLENLIGEVEHLFDQVTDIQNNIKRLRKNETEKGYSDEDGGFYKNISRCDWEFGVILERIDNSILALKKEIENVKDI